MQIALAMSLGSIRYDKLFDYSDKLEDPKARYLVKRYYKKIKGISRVTKVKNKQRIKDGHLAYPYFLADLMPNSIHTWI